MKEVIYNYDNLKDDNITEVVIRTKALIVNKNDIILASENDIYEFPGGHLEANETFKECLKREIREETGIEIDNDEINNPFVKVTFLNKDWPEVGRNRKSEIYYYLIKTDKEPNLKNIKYTENEIKGNFRVQKVSLKNAIDVIKENIPNNEKNKVIAPDMIMVIEEYLKRYKDFL